MFVLKTGAIMPRTLHTRIRLGGRRTTLLNMKRVQAAVCLGATTGIGIVMLALKVFK